MKALLRFFLLFTISISSFSQDVIMQNGTINTCSGTFYDSGGASNNYANNETLILTICPENPGQRTRVDFTEFITEHLVDVMTIYDGSDTSVPVFGSFSGTAPLNFVIATTNNSSGCLTFEFQSNGATTAVGWTGTISCMEPCQEIIAAIDTTSPAPNTEGFIDVCIGTPISFDGSGTFGVSGSGATYTWDFGDGTEAYGTAVSKSYNIPGIFLVSLEIRDTNTSTFPEGCTNSNPAQQIVRVSGSPNFMGTEADNTILCFGESTNIHGMTTAQNLVYDCPPPESEETFLPDGNGVYSTCISVTCFDPAATLTDISQIADICMNIEHSFSGDLLMKITAPGGQEVILKNYPGGAGTFLGDANDDETTNPGIGLDYCFSMDGSVTLVNAPIMPAPSSPGQNTFVPGTYLPHESFQQLVGTPLNGLWCIEIVDNLAVDNGYIFSWELNFNDNLPQDGFDYTPAIISESWDADPSITASNGQTITVAPDTSGEHCYTYRVTDEFGCEFTEVVCITMAAPGQPAMTYYLDTDNDGFGDPNVTITNCSPTAPFGYVANNLDCNDANQLINPNASDAEGNGIDENCDGVDGLVLSVSEFDIHNINISPNPFESQLKIQVPSSNIGNALMIDIHDINGRKVYSKHYSHTNASITLDRLDTLSSNMYFITISDETLGVAVTKKIIKR